ncbi:MAG TPA: hypothetical protein VD866_32585, partial [Urbifossiella sp.]|nr:hypothetical protein [Urbifossiella sp.]
MSRSLGAFALGVMIVIGCGKPTDPQTAAEKTAAVDLKLFGLGYQIYLENNPRPPRTLDELKTVVSSDRPIEFDRYHLILGVDLNAVPDPRTVLGYEVDTPAKGGMVLFPGGKVERVSAEEFARLPQAVPAKHAAERPADVTFTPAAYYDECRALKDAMREKYRGKVVELKGVVGGVRSWSESTELQVVSPGNEVEYVRCPMPPGEEFWAKVGKWQ